MSDSGEILKKADALLGRYGRSARPELQEFPVLTEVIELHASAVPSVSPPAIGEDNDAVSRSVDPAHLRELETRIGDEVHQVVASALAQVLGEPLRERLEVHLNAAVDTVSAQVRSDLEAMVQAAVAEAIARLMDEKGEGVSPSKS